MNQKPVNSQSWVSHESVTSDFWGCNYGTPVDQEEVKNFQRNFTVTIRWVNWTCLNTFWGQTRHLKFWQILGWTPTNILYMSTMDVWSNLRWISASNMMLDSILFTPQVNLNPQIWGQLGRCNGIRVQTYALDTAYQWLKHFVFNLSNINVWSGLR